MGCSFAPRRQVGPLPPSLHSRSTSPLSAAGPFLTHAARVSTGLASARGGGSSSGPKRARAREGEEEEKGRPDAKASSPSPGAPPPPALAGEEDAAAARSSATTSGRCRDATRPSASQAVPEAAPPATEIRSPLSRRGRGHGEEGPDPRPTPSIPPAAARALPAAREIRRTRASSAGRSASSVPGGSSAGRARGVRQRRAPARRRRLLPLLHSAMSASAELEGAATARSASGLPPAAARSPPPPVCLASRRPLTGTAARPMPPAVLCVAVCSTAFLLMRPRSGGGLAREKG
ncbi:unnamed protein product [Urochloa humidicola]